ncbi:MAG TPA: DUF2127 domain-containing protein [Candidatus Paceibacterota bacterium]|nr:DUF2127 domain-containing protein [Candidatus Paceibacterota bacterium]
MNDRADSHERSWHEFFEFGIIVKGVDGFLQLVGGIALFFVSPATINAIALFFIRGELSEDPKDFLANLFLHATQGVIQAQVFAGILLVVHGAVKLFLVAGLVRNKLWAYPASIAIFGGFVLYQFYQLHLGYSLFLWVVTVVDILVIGLIVHEYRYVKKHGLKQKSGFAA